MTATKSIGKRTVTLEVKTRVTFDKKTDMATTHRTANISTPIGVYKNGKPKSKTLWSLPMPSMAKPAEVLGFWERDVARSVRALRQHYNVTDKPSAEAELDSRKRQREISEDMGTKLEKDEFQESILKNYELFAEMML